MKAASIKANSAKQAGVLALLLGLSACAEMPSQTLEWQQPSSGGNVVWLEKMQEAQPEAETDTPTVVGTNVQSAILTLPRQTVAVIGVQLSSHKGYSNEDYNYGVIETGDLGRQWEWVVGERQFGLLDKPNSKSCFLGLMLEMIEGSEGFSHAQPDLPPPCWNAAGSAGMGRALRLAPLKADEWNTVFVFRGQDAQGKAIAYAGAVFPSSQPFATGEQGPVFGVLEARAGESVRYGTEEGSPVLTPPIPTWEKLEMRLE